INSIISKHSNKIAFPILRKALYSKLFFIQKGKAEQAVFISSRAAKMNIANMEAFLIKAGQIIITLSNINFSQLIISSALVFLSIRQYETGLFHPLIQMSAQLVIFRLQRMVFFDQLDHILLQLAKLLIQLADLHFHIAY